MKIENEVLERRKEAIKLLSSLMQQVPLSKQQAYESYEEQGDDELDLLDYLPWILEEFSPYQKEKLVRRLHAYLSKEDIFDHLI